MKLNDFLEKSPKPRSTKQKVITVANEKKENELVVKIQALQKELDRLVTVDAERADFNQRMQAAEILLKETLEREVELKNQTALLQTEVAEHENVVLQKQSVDSDLRDAQGQLGIIEAVLEKAQSNNQELNTQNASLLSEVDLLRGEETNVRDRLEESLQQTSASINSLKEVTDRLDYKHKMFMEIEVKYKEEQRKTSDLRQRSGYGERIAVSLQEERDSLEQTRLMLKALAEEVEADNQEKRGAVKVTQTELKKLRGTVATMTKNMDGLIQENRRLNDLTSILKVELARPKYMSMAAIERSEGFKLPSGGYRKHFLGNSKPTLLKFKKEGVNHDNA